jgi:hypothetical protein
LNQRLSVVLLIMAVFLGSGCSGWKDNRIVTKTKDVYKGYINTDPSIDLTNPGVRSPGEERLAYLFVGVDQRLHELVRSLDGKDTFPEGPWFDQMLDRFDWLSGAGAVDVEGTVLARKPVVGIKVPDYDVLLQKDVLYPERTLRAGVEQTPLGPEFYLGSPFFTNNTWQGLLVVHFDFRSVVRFSPEPDELMVLYEGGVLWPGKGFNQEGLLAMNWSELLRKDVQGQVEIGREEYHWMARYIGQFRLVYLVRKG